MHFEPVNFWFIKHTMTDKDPCGTEAIKGSLGSVEVAAGSPAYQYPAAANAFAPASKGTTVDVFSATLPVPDLWRGCRHTPRDTSSTPQPTSEAPIQRRQPICSFRMYLASAVSRT